MNIDVYSSNLAQWISCFPRYARYFTDSRNVAFFRANPPPQGETQVSNKQWNQITRTMLSDTNESET